MSVDTQSLIIYDNKETEAFSLMKSLTEELNKIIRNEKKLHVDALGIKDVTYYSKNRNHEVLYKTIEISSYSFDNFILSFIYKGRKTNLMTILGTTGDYKELIKGKQSIFFSLNHDEIAVEIMEIICKFFKDMGLTSYINRNDLLHEFELIQ